MHPPVISNASMGQQIVLLLLLYMIYLGALAIYRITLHPLAKFPGPKLAAATYLYEFWFDVVFWGRYTHKIGHLHQKFGPIIRINPNELHCNDDGFVNSIYASGNSRRDKPSHFLRSFPKSAQKVCNTLIRKIVIEYLNKSINNIEQTLQATASHDLHRARRRVMNKFFSKAQVCRLESIIQSAARKLCDKILAAHNQGPINLAHAYSCFTADVITEYSFGESSGFLAQPGWEPNYKTSVDILLRLGHILRFFPTLGWIMEFLPLRVVQYISRDVGLVMHDLKVMLPQKISLVRDASKVGPVVSGPPRTIFSSLLEDPDLPPSEKSTHRLASEANSIMVGGTESTAVTLSLFTYHVISNPGIHATIRSELDQATSHVQRTPTGEVLESLPYFTAAVQEALRLVHGISGRAARIAPDENLMYHGSWTPPGQSQSRHIDFVVPQGFAIGMSAYLMHTDESIFPEPQEFRPQRWLDESGQRNRKMDKHLFSFSKGSRQCVGMQLAYWELYICAAALVLRVFPHLELYQTSVEDVAYDHDELIGKPISSSKGVRVLVSARR